MSDRKALVTVSGITSQIPSADSLIVGSGILSPAGSGFDITATPDGTNFTLAASKTLRSAGGTGALDWSGASGTFKTSTGAVSLNGDSTLAAGKNLLLSTTGRLDVAAAGTLAIGTVTATAITLGATGVTVTVPGNLTVTGTETLNGPTVFNANVTFGDATTDTVAFLARVGDDANTNPDINFNKAGNHIISIDQTAVDTAGKALTVKAGRGGTASAVAGGVGGTGSYASGQGGNGTATLAAGAGGPVTFAAGNAGDEGGGGGGGAGGDAIFRSGNASGTSASGAASLRSGDASTGVSGNVTVGTGITSGNGGSINLTHGSTSGTKGAINIGTTSDTGAINVGVSGITTTITGGLTQLTGAVSLTANAASSFTTSVGALTLTSAAAATWSTAAGALTITSAAAATWSTSAGALIVRGAAGVKINEGATTLIDAGTVTGAVTISASATSTFSTSAGALVLDGFTGISLKKGGTEYLAIGAATVQVKGAATLSAAAGTFINLDNDGRWLINSVAVSSTFTAAAAGVLSAGPASDASAYHFHSGAANLSVSTVAGESIATGAPVTMANAAGSPKSYNGEADNGTSEYRNVIGIADATVVLNATLSVLTDGERAIPDAIWDSVPVVGDVGKRAYLSEANGKLTLTAPTTAGSTVIKCGIITKGGAGLVKMLIQVGERVDL
jgi:hypothetical protein